MNSAEYVVCMYSWMSGKRLFTKISAEISIPPGTVKWDFCEKNNRCFLLVFNILWAKIVKQKIGLNLNNKKKIYFYIKKIGFFFCCLVVSRLCTCHSFVLFVGFWFFLYFLYVFPFSVYNCSWNFDYFFNIDRFFGVLLH